MSLEKAIRASSIGRISGKRMNLSIFLSIAKELHKHINTYTVMGTMISNVQDTGIGLRKTCIQSMKGGDSGVTRIVDIVHYSRDDRLCPGGRNRSEKPSQNLRLNRVLPDE